MHEFIPVVGSPLIAEGESVRFKGSIVKDATSPGGERAALGLYVSNQQFSGGSISVRFTLTGVGERAAAEILASYDPRSGSTLNVGIPPEGALLSARSWDPPNWNYLAQTGDHASLIADKEYHIEIQLHGSDLAVSLNGVMVLRTVITRQYPPSQIGLFFISAHDIIVSEFLVKSRVPRAFVICQFSSPYDEVYMEVIRNVCKNLNVEVLRADETQGPGIIIADIVNSINGSSFVIADITPVNANVFYELGYAHGIGKPAILIAERNTKLPFDVSPHRTLFYENTIGGKSKLEKGLMDAINSVLGRIK